MPSEDRVSTDGDTAIERLGPAPGCHDYVDYESYVDYEGCESYEGNDERGGDDEGGEGAADGDGGDQDAVEQLDAGESRFVADLTARTDRSGVPTLQLGVIGCPETAQLRHFPRLSALDGTSITAIADRSPERLEHVGDQYGIADRHEQGSALITEHRADLDGIVICSPPHTHAELVRAALEADLATFVEPPLAIAPDDAWSLCERVERAEVPVLVGYARRFDQAYHRFRAALRRSGDVRYVAAYDVTPAAPRIRRTASDTVSGSLPAAAAADAERDRTRQAKDALETDADWIATAYLSHLTQSCHDVNLLRALFDDVAEINHASLGGPEAFLTAELGHEDGTGCHFTSGRTNGAWSEAYVRVDAADRMVRLEASRPSCGDAPSAVTIRDGADDVVTRRYEQTTDESVTHAFGSFLAAIREGTETRTPVTDAAKDVELVAELVYRATATAEEAQ